MAHQRAFDPQAFLAKVGAGRTIVTFQKQCSIFTQGEAADAVFYIQDGQVKLSVVSAQGKEAVIAILAAQAFLAKAVWPGSRGAWPRPRRSATAC
jgi:CRP-like cAMP-binding protein